MRNLLLGLVFGVFVGALVMGKSSQAQQTQAPRKIFYITGTGWQTCSDWNSSSDSFKIAYVIGHDEGVLQLKQLIPSDLKESFDVPTGVKYGDEMKGLSAFCENYRNVRIPLVNALGFVLSDIAGGPPMEDKSFQTLRCLAAAGDDGAKIRDCYARQ